MFHMTYFSPVKIGGAEAEKLLDVITTKNRILEEIY